MKALFLVIPLIGVFSCVGSKQESQPDPAVWTLPPPAIEAPEPVIEAPEPVIEAPPPAIEAPPPAVVEAPPPPIVASQPVIEAPPPAIEAPELVWQEEEEEEEAGFDPLSITVQEKETTMGEMRLLIAEINRVIRAKDYERWVAYLAEDFITAINSPDYLAQLSESSRQLKGQNIVLRTPQDYFTYVVVASRENIRVDASLDDIEFLSHNRVKAFTLNARKQRLRLFEFVKAGDAWKIAFTS
jgi:hypothetical protein